MSINKFPLGLALIASSVTCVSAQDSSVVYTDPVGYVKLGNTAEGEPAVASFSDLRVSVPLERTAEFVGTVSSASSNALTLEGNPGFDAGRWVAAEGEAPYLIKVNSTNESGAWGLISANTADTVTATAITGDFANLVTGNEIEILRAWTVGNIFEGQTIPGGTQLFLYGGDVAGVNINPSTILLFDGTNWRDTFNSFEITNDLVLHQGEGFILRTDSGVINDLAIFGDVPVASHRVTIVKNDDQISQDTQIGFLGAVPEIIGESGLGFTGGDELFVYDSAATGQNQSPSTILLFDGTDWRDTFDSFSIVSSEFELKPGEGYIYRQANGLAGDYEWTDVQSHNEN